MRDRENARFGGAQLRNGVVEFGFGHFQPVGHSGWRHASGESSWHGTARGKLEENFHSLHFDGDDFLRRAHALQLSSDEHCDAIAEHLGVRQNVRREENRAALPLQIQNDVADFAATDGIEPRCRLIQKNYLWIVQDRLRDSYALQHAFREAPQLNICSGAQPDALEKPRDALSPVSFGKAEETRGIIEQLARSQIIVEVRLLRQEAYLAVHLDVIDRASANPCGTARRKNQPHQELERGRLSRAVRPEESEHLALAHLERQPIQRSPRALAPEADRVVLGQPFDFNGRGAHNNIFLDAAPKVNRARATVFQREPATGLPTACVDIRNCATYARRDSSPDA